MSDPIRLALTTVVHGGPGGLGMKKPAVQTRDIHCCESGIDVNQRIAKMSSCKPYAGPRYDIVKRAVVRCYSLISF